MTKEILKESKLSKKRRHKNNWGFDSIKFLIKNACTFHHEMIAYLFKFWVVHEAQTGIL